MQHKDNITLIAFSFLLFSEFQLQITVIHFTSNYQLLLTGCTPVTSHEKFKLFNVSENIYKIINYHNTLGEEGTPFDVISNYYLPNKERAPNLPLYSCDAAKKKQLAVDKSSNTHPHRTTAQGELCSSLCSTCHATENSLKH